MRRAGSPSGFALGIAATPVPVPAWLTTENGLKRLLGLSRNRRHGRRANNSALAAAPLCNECPETTHKLCAKEKPGSGVRRTNRHIDDWKTFTYDELVRSVNLA